MPHLATDEDLEETIWVSVPLDLGTFVWLAKLAGDVGRFPEDIGARILKDVRHDDEKAEGGEAVVH